MLKAAKVQVSAVVDQCCKIDESRLHGSPLQTRSSIFWQLKKAPITSAKLSEISSFRAIHRKQFLCLPLVAFAFDLLI